MKIRTVIGLVGATAASLVGMAGLAAAPAGADGSGAVQVPADQLTSYLATNYGYAFPGIFIFATPFVQAADAPNSKLSGNCSAASFDLMNDPLVLNFVSGNAHVYRTAGNLVFPTLPGGLNAEGTADLIDLSTGDTGFVGPAHVWLGQNANANGQYYAGETVSFTGTAPDGSTISITANPGEIHKASAPPGPPTGGWGEQNLSCNIVSAG